MNYKDRVMKELREKLEQDCRVEGFVSYRGMGGKLFDEQRIELFVSKALDKQDKMLRLDENFKYYVGGMLDCLSMVEYDDTLLRANKINEFKDELTKLIIAMHKEIK